MQTQGTLLLASLDPRAEMVCSKMWLLGNLQALMRVCLDRAMWDVGSACEQETLLQCFLQCSDLYFDACTFPVGRLHRRWQVEDYL